MTNDADLSPGAWLKAAREKAGYPVATRFAGMIGVTPQVLSTYEVGKTRIPDDVARRVAEVLGKPELEVRRSLGLWVPADESPTEKARRKQAKIDAEIAELVSAAAPALQRIAELQAELQAERDRLRDSSVNE